METIAHFNIAPCRETEGRELDPVTVINGVRRLVSEPNRGSYYVAEIDGEVVGQTAHTFEWSDWRNGEIWWIQSVYVHPHFRSKGVFRTLFTHIKELGEADKGTQLIVFGWVKRIRGRSSLFLVEHVETSCVPFGPLE